MDAKLAQLLADNKALVAEAEAYLKEQNKPYTLSEWITIKEYAKRHNLAIQTVASWIEDGIIPARDLRHFPYLNDLRLIRNKIYPQ